MTGHPRPSIHGDRDSARRKRGAIAEGPDVKRVKKHGRNCSCPPCRFITRHPLPRSAAALELDSKLETAPEPEPEPDPAPAPAPAPESEKRAVKPSHFPVAAPPLPDIAKSTVSSLFSLALQAACAQPPPDETDGLIYDDVLYHLQLWDLLSENHATPVCKQEEYKERVEKRLTGLLLAAKFDPLDLQTHVDDAVTWDGLLLLLGKVYRVLLPGLLQQAPFQPCAVIKLLQQARELDISIGKLADVERLKDGLNKLISMIEEADAMGPAYRAARCYLMEQIVSSRPILVTDCLRELHVSTRLDEEITNALQVRMGEEFYAAEAEASAQLYTEEDSAMSEPEFEAMLESEPDEEGEEEEEEGEGPFADTPV